MQLRGLFFLFIFFLLQVSSSDPLGVFSHFKTNPSSKNSAENQKHLIAEASEFDSEDTEHSAKNLFKYILNSSIDYSWRSNNFFKWINSLSIYHPALCGIKSDIEQRFLRI